MPPDEEDYAPLKPAPSEEDYAPLGTSPGQPVVRQTTPLLPLPQG